MKQLKKLIAVALVFAMVLPGIHIAAPQMKEVQAEESASQDDKLFAGYYADDTYEHVAKVKGGYQKYVNAGLLNVKLQLKDNGDSYSLRLISSIDSLKYKNVGFRISVDSNQDKVIAEDELVIAWKTQEVVKRIDAKTSASKFVYNYSPKVIDTASEYFVTGIIENIGKNNTKDFLVEPFWTTMDGTVVYGQNRWFSIDDMVGETVNNRINIPVEMTQDEFDAVNVATINSAEYNIYESYYDDVYGHFSVEVDKLSLPSASEVTFGGKTIIYRNLYTTGKANANATADKSFYDLYKNTTNEFIIATAADLYALRWIESTHANLTGKTFYLVCDIDLNDVNKVDWETGEKIDPNYTISNWTSLYFYGILDGQMHTIRGLHSSNGLCAKTYATTVLKNFKLVDSYIQSSSTDCASIVGMCQGSQLDTIYSEATVNAGTNRFNGGIVGRVTTNDGTVINNCQYAGKLTSTRTSIPAIGGIVGTNDKSIVIKNCLFSGEIECNTSTSYALVLGGIIGGMNFNTSLGAADTTAEIVGCMSTGTFNVTVVRDSYGIIVGQVANATGSIIRNNIGHHSSWSAIGAGGTGYTDENNKHHNTSVTDKTSLYGAEGWRTTFLNDDYFVAVTNATPELKSFSTRKATELADVSAVQRVDTGWYDSEATDKNFTIYTEEEFAGLIEEGKAQYFVNTTITLGADMVLNEGDVPCMVAAGQTPGKTYTPIAHFNGTFNGNGKTISGLYISQPDVEIVGLFKTMGGSASNFRLINSYIEGKQIVGGVIGRATGNVDSIYCDATIVSHGAYNGGIIGQAWTTAFTMDNCWYEGTLNITAAGICYSGGILGENRAANGVQITNCLYSGNIITESGADNPHLGGINGSTGNASNTGAKTTIQNCISTGTFKTKSNKNGCVASILGNAINSNTTVSDSYGLQDSWKHAFAYIVGTDDENVRNNHLLPEASMIDNQLSGFGTDPWIYIQDGTPELRSFIKGTAYVAEDTQITSGTIGNGETVQP